MDEEKTKAAGSANLAALIRNGQPQHSLPTSTWQVSGNRVSYFWQDAFREALQEAGLAMEEPIVVYGKVHRFHVQGDRPGSRNGWYILFDGNWPAGQFGCWKRNLSHHWSSHPFHQSLQRTSLLTNSVHQRNQDQKTYGELIVKESAAAIWHKATPATHQHPYLLQKKVRAHGVRENRGQLVIPLRDIKGQLQSLQFIAPDGTKRFLRGGRKAGCYFALGSPPTSKLLICEGYATGASLFEATGLPVAVSFDVGNLKSVGFALREKFPLVSFVFCADNDASTPGNPGIAKAIEAAELVHGTVVYPHFDGGTQ